MTAWWLAAGCSLGNTDVGDLATEGQTGGQTEGETEGATEGETEGQSSGSTTDPTPAEGTTSPLDCSGEDCTDGCCEGFGCNFANVCVACTPEGEPFDIDGAGCCEGLLGSAAEFCYAPTCADDVCPDGVEACAPLSLIHSGDQFALACPPELCLTSRTVTLSNGAGTPGLECTGPDGSEDCMASGEALQQYTYDNDSGATVTLAFDAAILADYSTDAFNAHFDGIEGRVLLLDTSVPSIALVGGEHTALSPFVYADGRLQFTIALTLTADNAFTHTHYPSEDCVFEGEAGTCACYYEDLGEYEIAVDLAIEGP